MPEENAGPEMLQRLATTLLMHDLLGWMILLA